MQVITVEEVSSRIRTLSLPPTNNSIESSQEATNVVGQDKGAAASLTGRKEEATLTERGDNPSLQQSLDKIMAGLETRRKTAGRPDNPMVSRH